ncbi:hypothetical protein EVAR_64157_1 [Eumeta japonica]|uniref:Uncharacterized protein n=1 Tax=Eumeta variegata TaxID=151549 RepID=A0A4C1ZP30_EUMVA|nr:hypothetical protein EVAR_64157_1 [Eumeta japonica]
MLSVSKVISLQATTALMDNTVVVRRLSVFNCGSELVPVMAAAGGSVPECSVRLWRCDRAPTAAVRAAPHVSECDEMPLTVIKTECAAEASAITQGLLAAVSQPREDSVADTNLLVNQRGDFIMKREDEAEEVMIPHELEIGPTVLQQKTPVWSRPPSDQRGDFIIKREDEPEEVMIIHELDIGPTVLQQKTAVWPLVLSDQRFDPSHSQELPIPIPLESVEIGENSNGKFEELDEKDEAQDPSFELSAEPHLLTQGDFNISLRDLNLSKKQAQLLGSCFKG